MYNNKGGVSKTTTLFNLGVFLARDGCRVLFADCDPQCNLIESALYEHLYLFRGDLEFSLAETYLGTAWNQAVTENIHEKNTYVALYKLLHSLGRSRGYDYILCDVGPSTGAITRTVVLACDGLFLPLVPDRFCNQAVRLLGRVVREWMSRHEQISQTLTPFNIDTFPGRPLLLGAIIQNFKVHSGSRAKQSYVRWQERISRDIRQYLLADDAIVPADGLDPEDPYIATIRDVGPLAPVAQIFGRAMFDIEQKHTKEASTTGQMPSFPSFDFPLGLSPSRSA